MIWLIVIVGIGILIFFVLRAAALNKTPPLERVEPGTILTPAGAARAEAEKYDKEQEEKYFQSPLTKRIIASISDGTGVCRSRSTYTKIGSRAARRVPFGLSIS